MSSRREFLRQATIGGCTLLGWPRLASWATEPTVTAGSLKLVFFTDIHARNEWETPAALLQAAAAINAVQPDLVLCGGDMIAEGYILTPDMAAERWGVYRAMHDAIRPEPIVVIGNNDLTGIEPPPGYEPAADPRAAARHYLHLERTYRSFDLHGYHFILLDSIEVTRDELKYRGFIDAEQMAWLRDDLAQVPRERPIILVSHMPLLTGFYQMTEGLESPVPSNRGLVNNREVLAACERHRLLAVLQGHLHVNELLRWRGTTFITGGAVCGKWWRGDFHGTEPGFGVLHLHPDRVDWVYHGYGWEAKRPDGQ